MDPIKNPFSPGAGSPPPELAGRSDVLDQAKILLGRVRIQRAEKSILLTGLRGVGKTVLLNEIEKMARNDGYKTILVEAHEGKTLAALLAPALRKTLYELDRIADVGDKAKRGLRVLKNFLGSITLKVGEIDIGLDIEPEHGSADSGDLEMDLSTLFEAVAEAGLERQVPIALLIDEIQYFSSVELSALIMAMHRLQQRQLPFVLIGAGLPVLPGLMGDSKSYAERLFSFPIIGPLSPEHAKHAVLDPILAAGEQITDDALTQIVNLTQGYPYFLQEWGYQCWNLATHSPINDHVVTSANSKVVGRLDDNFFRVRFERLTNAEKTYLRAMAELGGGPHRTSDIAGVLSSGLSKLGPARASLIKKGMIYSPSHGDLAFTVPLFDEFMRRMIP